MIKKAMIIFLVLCTISLCAKPPALGTERIFVIAEVPSSVDFERTQRFLKKKIERIVRRGAFRRVGHQHITFLEMGDVPLHKIGRVKQAVDDAVKEFNKRNGMRGLKHITVPYAQIKPMGRNALVLDVKMPREAYELFDMLHKAVSKIIKTYSSKHWKPHITIGRVSKMSSRKKGRLHRFLKTARMPAKVPEFSINEMRLYAGRKKLASYKIEQEQKKMVLKIPQAKKEQPEAAHRL
jgi:2'-5' RNA ligase